MTGLEGEDRAGVAGELADDLGLAHVPEPGRAVGRTREEQVAVLGRERQRGDLVGVALQFLDGLAVADRKDPDNLVVTGNRDLGAIGRKASAVTPEGRGPSFLSSLPSSTEQIRMSLLASAIAACLPLSFRAIATSGSSLPPISLTSLPSAGVQTRSDLVGARGGHAGSVEAGCENRDRALRVEPARLGDRKLPEPGQPSEPAETSNGLPGT